MHLHLLLLQFLSLFVLINIEVLFWTFGFFLFKYNNFNITIIQWLRGTVDLNTFFDTT